MVAQALAVRDDRRLVDRRKRRGRRVAPLGTVVLVRRAVVLPGHDDVGGGSGRTDLLTGFDGRRDGTVVEREGGVGGPLLVRIRHDPLGAVDALAGGVPRRGGLHGDDGVQRADRGDGERERTRSDVQELLEVTHSDHFLSPLRGGCGY